MNVAGIPKLFLGQVFFGGLGYQGKKNTQLAETNGCLALPPKATRPQNRYLPESVWLFGSVPQASKKHVAKKHIEIPLTSGFCENQDPENGTSTSSLGAAAPCGPNAPLPRGRPALMPLSGPGN